MTAPDNAIETIPEARIEAANAVAARRWRTRLWWLTALCVLLAIGITASSLRSPGDAIVIHFRNGHGIKAGDTLRYLGIDIGAVSEVHLAKDMSGIDVHVLLAPEHKAVAVEGSRFWIERPRLRIGQVTGLETVIGAKYVGMIPGDSNGSPQHEFTGLESPLAMAEQESIDIRIRFPAGEGLTAGDPVRYLGIDVGEVTNVELNEQLNAVSVSVRLVGSAKQLARAGTQFWVERPRLDISEVRGLETLVGGRYLAIEPAIGDSDVTYEFAGLTEAPPLLRREGSLELELEARNRMGLVRGAPVSYRGLEIGRVADVALATDGASVTVRVIIEPQYADLIRKNSVWWSAGGVRMDAGLTGFNLTVDSFSAWLRGGVAVATPEPPGDKVVTGYRFGLAEKAEPEWLAWQPRIATGTWSTGAGDNLQMPRLVRVGISWRSSFLGFTARRSVQAWGLPLEDGRLCVPASVLQSARDAGHTATLEVAGISQSINLDAIKALSGIAYLTVPPGAELEKWSASRTAQQPWNGKTSLLIVNPEMSEPLPLDPSRAAAQSDGSIEINAAVALHRSLEGSAIIDASSGELLGLLVSLNKKWVVRSVSR